MLKKQEDFPVLSEQHIVKLVWSNETGRQQADKLSVVNITCVAVTAAATNSACICCLASLDRWY